MQLLDRVLGPLQPATRRSGLHAGPQPHPVSMALNAGIYNACSGCGPEPTRDHGRFERRLRRAGRAFGIRPRAPPAAMAMLTDSDATDLARCETYAASPRRFAAAGPAIRRPVGDV